MPILQELLDRHGAIDVRDLSWRIDKVMKKAMAFTQTIKERLDSGESRLEVFNQKLPFDQGGGVLVEMVLVLKQVIRRCDKVDIVAVQADVQKQDLPSIAESAEPVNPAFYFENV